MRARGKGGLALPVLLLALLGSGACAAVPARPAPMRTPPTPAIESAASAPGGLRDNTAAPRAHKPMLLRRGMPAPVRLSGEAPEYPAVAQLSGVAGTVILLITVDPQGAVSNVTVLKNVPILGAHCVEVVRGWRYQPYLYRGVAVPFMVRQPFEFRLARK